MLSVTRGHLTIVLANRVSARMPRRLPSTCHILIGTPARDTQRSRGCRCLVDRLARAPARGAEIAACAVAVLEVGRVDESLLPLEQMPPPGPAARWWSGRAGSRP